MKRLRLSLGPRQTDALLLAIAYAVDTFAADEEDREIGRETAHMIGEWERVREVIRRERARQRVR